MNKQMIAAVRKHALENYNEGGWDFVVEAFDDVDLWRVISECATVDAAIRETRSFVKQLNDYRRDIVAEAGEPNDECPQCSTIGEGPLCKFHRSTTVEDEHGERYKVDGE